MRKLLSLALALAMCVTLAACGGGDTPTESSGGAGGAEHSAAPAGDASTPVEDAGDSCSNYDVLNSYTQYVVLPMDRLTASPWEFSGGYNASNGAEMEQEELDSTLSVYGGTLQIEFKDEKTANLVQGAGTIPGTYRVLDDGASINFTFESQGTTYKYVGVFTAIGDDETPVLLFLSPEAPDVVLYMTN